MANAIAFQYSFLISRKCDEIKLSETNVKLLSDLSFGTCEIAAPYLNRKELTFTTSIFDHGNEGFPVLEINYAMTKATLDTLEFILEVVAVPSKLIAKQREHLEKILEKSIEDENFKIWWENDPRGPRKRPLPDKLKILQQLKEIPFYNGSSDLKLEDIEITIPDALQFFGFERTIKPKELKKVFKKKFREYQLKHHPDSESGDESTFMHVQNCRDVLEKWMKRS